MSGCILIADEVTNNRILLIAMLSAAGYDVQEARNPDQLWAKLAQEAPNLVIMDSGFGIGGCFENCHKFKADPKFATIPLIVLAQDFDKLTRLVALRAGADEILPRPINEHILRARIRNLLRASTLSQEVLKRETTALELGFSDPSSGFAAATNIVAIEAGAPLSDHWRSVLADFPNAICDVTTPPQAFERIEQGGVAPELIVLSTGLHLDRLGMSLISELRTRSLTRHSAIMVCHDPSDRLAAVSALDLGANDLVESDSLAAEIRMRMRAQLTLHAQSRRLRSTIEKGLEMAVTDPLTGLFNRRYAMPHLLRIARVAQEKEQPFAVMVLDLDHFKRINDRYGHSAGDKVLIEVSERLRQNLRGVDLVARVGGEEFLVVMPDTSLEAAKGAAERLRRVVQATPVSWPQNAGQITVTMSIGVALGALDRQENTKIELVIDQADRALMHAKMDGRNKVNLGQLAA